MREELRVKDIRTVRILPHKRPHYPPTERMAILELRAARGWSLEQTAKAFLLTSPTVACWGKRLDEEGSEALVQIREPVNKVPDFVRYAAIKDRVLSPALGRESTAHSLSNWLESSLRAAQQSSDYFIGLESRVSRVRGVWPNI